MVPSSRSRCLVLWITVWAMGCTSYTRQAGVNNAWRDADLAPFQIGVTTQSEIMKQLGPPSQVIGLTNSTVFYYLLEETDGSALVFTVLNLAKQKKRYDRAIFFFDDKGILLDYALSLEEVEYAPPNA